MTIPSRDECIDAAAGVLAEATWQLAEIYARGGAMAVAEACWVPGGPSLEDLAAGYEADVQEDRAARAKNEAA
jgi:hypothetical protein